MNYYFHHLGNLKVKEALHLFMKNQEKSGMN